jgi:hypothetical protein
MPAFALSEPHPLLNLATAPYNLHHCSITESGLRHLLAEDALLWGGAALGTGDLALLVKLHSSRPPTSNAMQQHRPASASSRARPSPPPLSVLQPVLGYQAAAAIYRLACSTTLAKQWH